MKRIVPLPNHVAIIMDGNGRWAKQRGLLRLEGHKAGVENIRPVIECLDGYGIKYVTLYVFSTENWDRPEDEIESLFCLFEDRVDKETPELHRRGVKFCHLGRLEELPPELQLAITRALKLTENNIGMNLGFAFNYGGRREILDAVRRLIAEGISPQNIDEQLFSSYLYTDGLPDVDLLIRTGGELRVSNFLLWQIAYSECYFTQVLWPDFNEGKIEEALLFYSQRQRRFGGL